MALSISALVDELGLLLSERTADPIGTTRNRKGGTYVKTSSGWKRQPSKKAATHEPTAHGIDTIKPKGYQGTGSSNAPARGTDYAHGVDTIKPRKSVSSGSSEYAYGIDSIKPRK